MKPRHPSLRRYDVRLPAGVALTVTLALAACESTPTAFDPDDVTTEAVQAIVVEEGYRLVLVEDLEAHVLQMLEERGAEPAADAARDLLFDAGILASEAEDARLTGFGPRADRFHQWTTESWLEAAVLVLSPEFHGEVSDGVGAVLEAVEREIARSGSSRAVDQNLRQVRFALTSAAELRDAGQEARGLLMAMRAAQQLLDLDPHGRVERLIMRTHELLDRAAALAGEEPHPALTDAFGEAGEACTPAEEALLGGSPREAGEHAVRCHWIARTLVLRLAAGARGDQLADHARIAFDRALDSHSRAVARAGEEPAGEVETALTSALVHLESAGEAFELEQWRPAIALARTSAAVSTRILLRFEGDANPEALAVRAAKSIRRSGNLSVPAGILAASSSDPAVIDRLERADASLDQARFSYSAGQWRRALIHSVRAGDIFRRLILDL